MTGNMKPDTIRSFSNITAGKWLYASQNNLERKERAARWGSLDQTHRKD